MSDSDSTDYFSIDFWYHIFRENTVRTRFINATPEFIEYMLKDGVVLPQNNDITRDDPRVYRLNEEIDEDENEAENIDEDKETTEYHFVDLENEIQETIDDFHGECFVRSNWSSAKDASWILGSLKCTTPGHVLLLLKTSDRICDDFAHSSISDSVTPIIALQRWCNYYPSMEFCLYIKNNKLIAISQKDTSVFYPFLISQKDKIMQLCSDFVNTRVKNRFPVKDFEMDIYIDKKEKVWVVNMNAFDEMMNPGLFTIEELKERQDNEIDYRVIEEESSILPSDQMFYQLPMDMHCLTSNEDIEKYINNLTKSFYVYLI